ncbi:MAG TPA: hypothetical protein VFY06_01765 [Verrucomicrobiae bacterium]|nr:hypothetical protein [Verrucomicrobiae bacterium]
MKNIINLLAAALFSTGLVVSAADITGTITLQGTPPPEVPYTPLMKIAYCASCHTNTPQTKFYVVGNNGALADVVVYLKNADGKAITGRSTGASQPPVVLDQKGCLYTPTILAIQTGQTLTVKNSDNCIHNVHCTPTVSGNKSHNDIQTPGGADLHYTFPKPEMFITFRCDIHPWMFAWVSVFDNPYFAVSGTDGKFVIKNVPPGKYTLVADHRKLGTQTAAIEVKNGKVTRNFTFKTPVKK